MFQRRGRNGQISLTYTPGARDHRKFDTSHRPQADTDRQRRPHHGPLRWLLRHRNTSAGAGSGALGSLGRGTSSASPASTTIRNRRGCTPCCQSHARTHSRVHIALAKQRGQPSDGDRRTRSQKGPSDLHVRDGTLPHGVLALQHCTLLWLAHHGKDTSGRGRQNAGLLRQPASAVILVPGCTQSGVSATVRQVACILGRPRRPANATGHLSNAVTPPARGHHITIGRISSTQVHGVRPRSRVSTICGTQGISHVVGSASARDHQPTLGLPM